MSTGACKNIQDKKERDKNSAIQETQDLLENKSESEVVTV